MLYLSTQIDFNRPLGTAVVSVISGLFLVQVGRYYKGYRTKKEADAARQRAIRKIFNEEVVPVAKFDIEKVLLVMIGILLLLMAYIIYVS